MPQISTYSFRIEMSSKLFKSLNTLTLPNFVTLVRTQTLYSHPLFSVPHRKGFKVSRKTIFAIFRCRWLATWLIIFIYQNNYTLPCLLQARSMIPAKRRENERSGWLGTIELFPCSQRFFSLLSRLSGVSYFFSILRSDVVSDILSSPLFQFFYSQSCKQFFP